MGARASLEWPTLIHAGVFVHHVPSGRASDQSITGSAPKLFKSPRPELIGYVERICSLDGVPLSGLGKKTNGVRSLLVFP